MTWEQSSEGSRTFAEDGQLWHKGYSGSWYGPEPLGGSIPPGGQLASDPSPVANSDGTVDIFWKGTDANLWHKRLGDGYDPENLGAGALGSGPFAVTQSKWNNSHLLERHRCTVVARMA
jgi:hypothetical protein